MAPKGARAQMPTLAIGKRANSNSAFTLIELMVVMALVVILTAIAVPNFVLYYEDAKVRATLRGLIARLNYAHNMALGRRYPVAVVFDLDAQTVHIEVPSTTESEDVSASSIALQGSTGESASDISQLPEDIQRLLYDQQFEIDPELFVPDQSRWGRPWRISSGVEITSIQDDETGVATDTIIFKPDGTATPARIVITDTHGIEHVIVVDDVTGEPRIESEGENEGRSD